MIDGIYTKKAAIEKSQEIYSNVINLEFINFGRHRAAFYLKSRKYILKIPINSFGYDANRLEASFYKLNKTKFAKCRLLKDELLVMEYVEDFMDYKKRTGRRVKLPKWCYDIDNLQVGFNIKGKLVAYDYADL
jgi:hypothetical protein